MNDDLMTEFLPNVRCTPAMKQALVRIARRSISKNIADHIRFALDEYITKNGEAYTEDEPETPEPELVQ